jgi:hypothetical protein
VTGAEHYREAEELLDLAQASGDTVFATYLATKAQAHATLALAAATAEPAMAAWSGVGNGKQWIGVVL